MFAEFIQRLCKITGRHSRFLIIISLFSIILHLPYINSSLESDESMYIVVSDQMSKGHELYSEIYVGKTPGAMYVYSSLITIFGLNITLLRSAVVITNIMVIWSTYYLTKRLSTMNHAMLSSFLVALYISHPAFGAFWVRMDSFVILFATLSSLCIVRAIQDSREDFFLLSGLMCGLSFIFKQPGIMIMVPIQIPIIMMALENRNSFLLNIRRSFVVIVGFLIPVGLLLIKLKISGSLESMIFMTIEAQTGSSGTDNDSFLSFPFFYYENGLELIEVFSKMPIVFYLGSCAILFRLVQLYRSANLSEGSGLQKIRNSMPRLVEDYLGSIILVSWVVAYVALFFKITSRESYVLYLLPPMCILASSVIIKIYEALRTESQLSVATNGTKSNIKSNIKSNNIFSVIVIFFILFSLIPYPYPTNFVGNSSVYHDDDTLIEASNYIRSTSSPDDKILTLCYLPQLYILSEREPSSILYYSLIGIGRTSINNLSEDLISNVEYNRPIYIVTVENNEYSQTLNGTGEWYSHIPVLINYIHANYHIDKIFRSNPYSWPNGDIYIWKINQT